MPLAPGTRLEHYEIAGPLGVGGMGEVYRAHDTRLRREVAIKILPPHFAADPSRLARFEREAQVLAALNHPNIAAIYGLENANGIRFLVLELVEGPTLAERIASGPIPLDEALKIARQIADALEVAHDKGIVHRDLKPANVKVTSEGKVKVLDFGLAAVIQPQSPQSSDPSNSPTLTMGATQAGVILGTAPYMSPEQARGQAVDKRADIWGFGVLLYEMVTGQRLFRGDTVSDTLASVLKEQPDINRAPAKVRRLLESCLEKDPKQRLRDIADAWRLIDNQPALSAPISEPRPKGAVYAALALAILALAALAFLHFREKPPVRELTRFEIPAPANATFVNNNGVSAIGPVVSPDGRKIAFIATGADRKPMLWVRPLDAEEARPLAGTEDAGGALIWSPDSRFLAFASGGKLKKIEATGGPAQTLCDVAPLDGGAWTSDNRILFGTLGPLQLVSAAGGMPTLLTTLDHSRNELAHEFPAMLPDGHHFLYLRLSIPLENGGVYIGSLDAKPEQQSAKKLLPDTTTAVYVPSPGLRDTPGDAPGFLLFVRGITLSSFTRAGTLMAQPFDPKRMEFTGPSGSSEAVPIAEQVGFGGFSVSPAGVLAFATAGTQGNTQLTWVDRKGNVLSTAGEVGDYQDLALSPDGLRVVYRTGTDLWLFEFARGGVPTKFTFGNLVNNPAWSADGSRIVFTSTRASGWNLYQKASNMAGQEDLLLQSPGLKSYPNWTHDGRFLMYAAQSSDGKGNDLWVLPTGGSAADRKPLSFLRTEFNEAAGRFSPDGRWVAYQSNQSGKAEIYVLPFDESNPGSSTAGALHQVSKDGGSDVHWSGDGKELFYMAPDGYLMSVDVSVAGSAFHTGTAQRLFKSPATGEGSWDVAADGKRFLMAAPPSSASAAPASRPYHVVVNWTELLKR